MARRLTALSLAVLACGPSITSVQAQSYNVSSPVILQDFESSYISIQNKMPDIFAAGFGGIYLPPPGITLNGTSVGYDVYDRFDLGTANQPTLYGTQNEFESVVQSMHQTGGSVYSDLLWAFQNGANTTNTNGFVAFPGLSTYLQSTNPNAPGYNSQGYNNTSGDFYPPTDSNQFEEQIAGLNHIDPASDYQFIRQPTTAGNPLNIPMGTQSYDGAIPNTPNPANAQYYPDTNATPMIENDPALGLTNVKVYPFVPSQPMSGTPVAENALGYLMRYAQWMIQDMGVDGFRFDGGNNTYPWVMNYLDLATYNQSNRYLLNGQKEEVFTFSEVYNGSASAIQQYISKTDVPGSSTVGADRDALDFPLYFAMAGNLTSNGALGSGQNNWYNVVDASIDLNDNGLMDGSQGVKFVSDQDVQAPYLSNVAYAYTLMLPGNATVYYNGQNFNNEQNNTSGGQFPEGGSKDPLDERGDALGGPYGNAITTLVDLRNRYGRGNYHQEYISQNLLAYERQGSALVLLSNSTTAGFESETVDVDFTPGTYLLEQTGNATSSFADPNGDISQLLQVNADSNSPTGASVNVRFLNNATFAKGGGSSYSTSDGYLVYGLPTPTGSLALTNVASIMPGATFNTSASNAGLLNGTERLSSVDVVTASSFQLQLTTNAAYLLGQQNLYDQDADGDNALFKVDGGFDVTGAGFVATDPTSVSYGYQAFLTANQPGYTSANGNGYYAQTINTTGMTIGYHYIEVIAFRHSTDPNAPPVYSDWTQTIYVDRGTPQSAISSFSPFASAPTTFQNRQLVVQSTDSTATSAYVYLNLPAGITSAQILNMVATGNNTVNGITYTGGNAGQIDSALFAYGFNNLLSGNNVATIVTYRPDGNYGIQRLTASQSPALSLTNANGLGPGDLSGDGKINDTDIYDFYLVERSNGQMFNPAADFNGDGVINLADWQAFGQLLQQDGLLPANNAEYVPQSVLTFYDELSTSVPEPACGTVGFAALSCLALRRKSAKSERTSRLAGMRAIRQSAE